MVTTKPTPQLLEALADGLVAILGEKRHADRVIERLLRSLPPRDERRSLVAESIYGVLRHLRRLVWTLAQPERFDREQLRACLRAWWVLEHIELSRSLRDGIPPRSALLQRWQSPPSRAVRYSLPDWLDQFGARQLGDRWERLLEALLQPAPIVLRANTLHTTRDELRAELAAAGIESEPHPLAPEALLLTSYTNVFTLEQFHAGHFEMQDAASQAISHLLGVEPGMRVVDACAGSGGKTLHLAALMRNRGRIIALDTAAWKLSELRRRAARAGVSIIETRAITSTKVIKRLVGSADRLLLDAPCSGSGVWRRNPDGKWHLEPDELERCVQLQRQILAAYLPMLKPTGKALFCTCSIFPAEGEQHIEWLQRTHPQWRVTASGRFDPAEHGTDGFFWMLIERA